ncbi:MAG: type II 3-dehydroquinate dehydratase [Alphaproteobacteria bacterium]|nr:type II 3-dehydroquinate dehydratase [Alphaproteobacteria bacterium]MBP7759084.1 type II 3-dehydroquinate dehydratase [Alphaproteobacteria bacterium]MBP7762448.1 type II 3-dehydroquinate dehydratase [Alphaproteobacteria bacterium]MBP7904519.1 type II 3-dehydroquinate dehydratase [Alphaproteobacteria bacterium]
MKKIIILNGPNLNLLGIREPEIYGTTTLRDLEDICHQKAYSLDMKIDFRQTNHEGELIEWVQEARGIYAGMIINAAAFTHTSLALHDALKIVDMPIIEVHLTNPKEREPFRHFSYVELVAVHSIAGKGPDGYTEAIDKLAEILGK